VPPEQTEPLLEVRHLKKYYPLRRGLWGRPAGWLKAVDDVSFHINPGETLGLVGESGCGKTTTGRAVLRLVEPTGGEVLFRTCEQGAVRTHEVFRLPPRRLRALRRHLQIVFQDPYNSLNPLLTVGTTVAEGMLAHGLYDRRERRRRVGQLLERVGLDAGAADRYPHEFSGGQRQRIGIARALAVDPALVVCDEAVSALDVSVQAQVLNLLLDLQRERRLAYLFIAHDLAVVAHVSHRVAVMYQGQIVETAAGADLFRRPAHPYTRALLAAVPQGLRGEEGIAPATPAEGRVVVPAEGPTAAAPGTGCRFRDRCPEAMPECAVTEPPLIQLGGGHDVCCHRYT
jgi:oligopeptide/dipeptide ABC transporter ATP-binding protein